ncbi:MAG: Transcriptional regulatory protein FixJ [Pseudomonadota bacterium]|jgi:FixJ family two-component response regulator
MDHITLHIVGGESRSRAEQARVAFSLGHHAEVYTDLDELMARPPREGILLLADELVPGFPLDQIERLADRGVWLPIVVTATEPTADRAVNAIKGGSIDYLALPLEPTAIAGKMPQLIKEATDQASSRRRLIEARGQMSRLSRRESEVLQLLSAGSSNKEIARRLEISPRTVEIHRANMMSKLGANHAADAIRTWLDARVNAPALPLPRSEGQEGGSLVQEESVQFG